MSLGDQSLFVGMIQTWPAWTVAVVDPQLRKSLTQSHLIEQEKKVYRELVSWVSFTESEARICVGIGTEAAPFGPAVQDAHGIQRVPVPFDRPPTV